MRFDRLSFDKIIPSRLRRIRPPNVDILKFAGLLFLLVWLLDRGTEQLGYTWHWNRIPRYLLASADSGATFGPLLLGLFITLRISAVSFFFACIIGLTTALLRLSGSPLASMLARVFVGVVRNTPLLIQIVFLYFVVAPVLGISRFAAAVAALAVFEGAYASEIIRAGVQSISRGQWEAAYSLGLTTLQVYRKIILPQALRRVIPPLTSQTVSLVKDSALVSVISVFDLTMQAQTLVAETYLTFEIWFTVAAMYLAVTITLSTLAHVVENRLRVEE